MLSESTPCAPKAQIRSASRLPIPPPILKKYQVWMVRPKHSTLLVDSNDVNWATMRFNHWAFAGNCRAVLTMLFPSGVRKVVMTSVDPDDMPIPYTLTDSGRAALAAEVAKRDDWYYNGAGDWEGD